MKTKNYECVLLELDSMLDEYASEPSPFIALRSVLETLRSENPVAFLQLVSADLVVDRRTNNRPERKRELELYGFARRLGWSVSFPSRRRTFDSVASICNEAKDTNILVVSSDERLLGCLQPGVSLRLHSRGKVELWDRKKYRKKWGVAPESHWFVDSALKSGVNASRSSLDRWLSDMSEFMESGQLVRLAAAEFGLSAEKSDEFRERAASSRPVERDCELTILGDDIWPVRSLEGKDTSKYVRSDRSGDVCL
ncbi:hypothetical protein [Pelagicoccus sp. SDUM812002]|uniref:hypothetical protein n=1 Tax=Pelagicoccus sp. SDUM812002 TaxID=3041266 RepID=UPI00280DC135|nr:hypothetical protein [Pelagicoccus sp. SDUM812002]MDQ8188158.1 hypothetical protein [Pelagicoccus sp. SDUM812002]